MSYDEEFVKNLEKQLKMKILMMRIIIVVFFLFIFSIVGYFFYNAITQYNEALATGSEMDIFMAKTTIMALTMIFGCGALIVIISTKISTTFFPRRIEVEGVIPNEPPKTKEERKKDIIDTIKLVVISLTIYFIINILVMKCLNMI